MISTFTRTSTFPICENCLIPQYRNQCVLTWKPSSMDMCHGGFSSTVKWTVGSGAPVPGRRASSPAAAGLPLSAAGAGPSPAPLRPAVSTEPFTSAPLISFNCCKMKYRVQYSVAARHLHSQGVLPIRCACVYACTNAPTSTRDAHQGVSATSRVDVDVDVDVDFFHVYAHAHVKDLLCGNSLLGVPRANVCCEPLITRTSRTTPAV